MKKVLLFLAFALLLGGCRETKEDKGIVFKKKIIPAHTQPVTQMICTGKTVIPVTTFVYFPAQYIVYAYSEDSVVYMLDTEKDRYNQIEIGDTVFAEFEICE